MDEDEFKRLRAELMALAAGLTDDAWETTVYWRIYDSVVDFKEGRREQLEPVIERLRAGITSTWDSYREDYSSIEGVTAAGQVGHQVLEESFTFFLAALDSMEDAADGEEAGWSQALRCAELGSRKMMAVQALNRRLQSEAPTNSEHNGPQPPGRG
jgi:hypothetical protein